MKYIITLLILGEILMAATIQYIETNTTKVPVIYESDARLPLVTMQFTFTNSGSVMDANKAGLAKLSAKVMSEGTKTLGSAAFAEALEAKAIHISASSGNETFVIEMSSLKEEFEEGLKYFEALIKDPNLSEEAIKKVKTMTLGSLSSKESDFDYIASNELKATLFEGTVLAQPSSGTIESVKTITLSDVEAFIKANVVKEKLIVVIGGDVDFQVAKEKIAAIVNNMPSGSSSEVARYEVRAQPKESIKYKETEQAYIYFGSPYHIEESSPDFYKARVATFILGTGGFGSRMMEEIRVKRGLAYSAYAKIDVTKSSSYFNGYLQTKLDALDLAKKTVNEVIADFVKNGVSEDELEQTKKFLLGSEPLRVETMSQRLNRTFMEFYKGKELGYSVKELELIKNLKLEDLNTFIKAHDEINKLSYSIVTK